MIRNNKELKRSLFLLLGVCLLGILAGFLIAPQTGLLVLSVSVAICLIFLFTEISRYQKLQSFSGQLNALLTHGTPLPIQDYEEGELSLLANEIQKITLLLKERADTLKKDKAFLSDALADISHQLRTLKDARLIRSRRDGKGILYSLADDHVRAILDMGVEHLMEGK
jgi:DNA-binding transcriptional ArsR family regulator